MKKIKAKTNINPRVCNYVESTSTWSKRACCVFLSLFFRQISFSGPYLECACGTRVTKDDDSVPNLAYRWDVSSLLFSTRVQHRFVYRCKYESLMVFMEFSKKWKITNEGRAYAYVN